MDSIVVLCEPKDLFPYASDGGFDFVNHFGGSGFGGLALVLVRVDLLGWFESRV